MRSSKLPYLILLLLLVACFSLAAWLDPKFQPREQDRSTGILNTLMGDSRRMFANHFFVKADAYFHSGFYPTIFDNQESFKTPHMAEDAGALKGRNQGEETAFMGKPLDFIEAFERHFYPAVHTHLDQGGAQGVKAGSDLGEADSGDVREILPWLQISATLDPERIETYMVAAYWLRKRMGKVDEAEQFLREGLHVNPGNPALLFELGRIFEEDRKEIARPRNVWIYAVQKLDAQKSPKTDQDDFILSQLALRLARLEEGQGNLSLAIHWLQRYKPLSPTPDLIDKQIEELKRRISEGRPAIQKTSTTPQTK